MKQEISNIKLNFSCTQNWDDMLETNGGKFCNGCQKTVYDFTDKKADEFMSLLAAHNQGICGRFTPNQMAQEPVKQTTWKKWAIAAMVFIGVGSLLVEEAAAQAPKGKKPATVPEKANCPENMLMGEPVIFTLEPQAKANLNTLHNYLKTEFHGEPVLKCVLWLNFNVDKNGKPQNIRIFNNNGKEVNKNAEKEILNLLAKAPKWKNNQIAKENRDNPYSLSLTINNGKITGAERL